ncbi:hypothetical protein HUT19_23345 [Streptomyces sp. NA02950]|uniref:hypothetical protein n=1 Tax=Streptomyces sp. NA02950 TaxID=2742137 RepID=UPI00159241C9|nr:hypothetical protein [Streptomyces sp. NA02950]QKV94328.1 hypothetical protein HUT19_23345 [Streptomyces sp. NA02950]
MTDWQIDHASEWTVRRRSDDGFTIPLQATRNGRRIGTAELRLTLVSAEHLHAALCYALDGQPPPLDAPDCRRPIRYSRGGRQ